MAKRAEKRNLQHVFYAISIGLRCRYLTEGIFLIIGSGDDALVHRRGAFYQRATTGKLAVHAEDHFLRCRIVLLVFVVIRRYARPISVHSFVFEPGVQTEK